MSKIHALRKKQVRKRTHPSKSSPTCRKLDKEDTNRKITNNYNRLTKAGEEVGIDQ